jgi:predicted short-subunit dehydrogenase-like oxidoreductase (DUF2520 family)
MTDLKVSIIGTGNVAYHLAGIFTQKGVKLLEVRGRNIDKGSEISTQFRVVFSNVITGFHPDADIVILAVADDAVEKVVASLPKTNAVVVHTSGMESMHKLSVCTPNYGSFYPLQTFTRNREVDFSKVPVLVDGSSEEVIKKLELLAYSIADNVARVEDAKRSELHLAAVMVNNFTNHLFALAEKYTNDKKLDFNLLKPLMKETVEKALLSSPFEIQTGPARRKDRKTIEKHLSLIEDPTLKNLYELFTESIRKTYD